MRTLLRGFLAGIGFVAGATIAGGLIGYGVGKLAEGAIKRTRTGEPDDSPCSYCGEHHRGEPRHEAECTCGHENCWIGSHHSDYCAYKKTWFESWKNEASKPEGWQDMAARL